MRIHALDLIIIFIIFITVFNKETKNMSETNKEELKKRLTPIQWHVTQEKGTER